MSSKLRDDYSHLERLHQKSGHKDSVAIADEELALSRPSTSASSCVPYEAMGTLKINSFTMLPTGRFISNWLSFLHARVCTLYSCYIYMYICILHAHVPCIIYSKHFVFVFLHLHGTVYNCGNM